VVAGDLNGIEPQVTGAVIEGKVKHVVIVEGARRLWPEVARIRPAREPVSPVVTALLGAVTRWPETFGGNGIRGVQTGRWRTASRSQQGRQASATTSGLAPWTGP
jgi:hypothetical protein